MNSRAAITAVFFFTGTVLVSSCGVPICVVGLGNCKAIFDKYQNQPTPSPVPTTAPTLAISGVSSMSIATTPTFRFTATGGNGTYTWKVNPTSCGTFSSFTPGFFNATTAQTCTVTAVDSSPAAVTGNFALTITP